MYYAFFAPAPAKNASEAASWSGEVELRGLEPGKYRVVDYVNNKELGSVTAPNARLQASFIGQLLIEVTKE